jgi:hypothetical protein
MRASQCPPQSRIIVRSRSVGRSRLYACMLFSTIPARTPHFRPGQVVVQAAVTAALRSYIESPDMFTEHKGTSSRVCKHSLCQESQESCFSFKKMCLHCTTQSYRAVLLCPTKQVAKRQGTIVLINTALTHCPLLCFFPPSFLVRFF